MKKTFAAFCVLICISILWTGCEPRPILGTYSSERYIYIDSTASACGVDSCVINLPWLNNMIEATLTDSAQSKLTFDIWLYVDKYIYTDTIDQNQRTYFEISQDHRTQRMLYDCNGNVSTDTIRDCYGNIIYDGFVSVSNIVDITLYRMPNI